MPGGSDGLTAKSYDAVKHDVHLARCKVDPWYRAFGDKPAPVTSGPRTPEDAGFTPKLDVGYWPTLAERVADEVLSWKDKYHRGGVVPPSFAFDTHGCGMDPWIVDLSTLERRMVPPSAGHYLADVLDESHAFMPGLLPLTATGRVVDPAHRFMEIARTWKVSPEIISIDFTELTDRIVESMAGSFVRVMASMMEAETARAEKLALLRAGFYDRPLCESYRPTANPVPLSDAVNIQRVGNMIFAEDKNDQGTTSTPVQPVQGAATAPDIHPESVAGHNGRPDPVQTPGQRRRSRRRNQGRGGYF